MKVKNNKKQNEKQGVDNRVPKHGDSAGLHVEEIDRMVLPGHLKDQPRRQKRKECRGEDRSSPVVHSQALPVNFFGF
ncbi:hypothetical protein U1Q18_012590 [Sarracenia purpurea var. burkii]